MEKNYQPKHQLVTISLSLCIILLFVSNLSYSQYDSEYDLKQVANQVQENEQLFFEKNIGQLSASEVLYQAKTGQAIHHFSQNEIRTTIQDTSMQTLAYGLEFVNSNESLISVGQDIISTKINYHKYGKSFTNVPIYQTLAYKNLWQGIDAIFYEQNKTMKYDFIVQPHTNPEQVQFKLKGVKNIKVLPDGTLEFETPLGKLQKGKPYTYQEINGEKITIESSYKVQGDIVSFELGKYDPDKKLIIDPVALLWSTFLEDASTQINDMYVHPITKNIYVVGETNSTTYPNTLGRILNNGASASFIAKDAFVTCVSADGTAILWSTYIGGSLNDEAKGVFVNEAGDVFISGATVSPDFPINGTVNAYDATHNNFSDAFIMRLNNTGSIIKYSTFVGSSGADEIENRNIVVDGDNVYYAISANSSTVIPVKANAYQTSSTGNGVVVFCVNTTVGGIAGLVYSTFFTTPISSTYIGCRDIARDASGNIYLSFYAEGTVLTTSNAVQTYSDVIATNGGSNPPRMGYVVKFDAALSNLLYASVISPFILNNGDYYNTQSNSRMTVDDAGNIYFSSLWEYNSINQSDVTTASNIQQLNYIDPFDDVVNILCKIPASNPSQYEFVNVHAGADLYNYEAGTAIDNQGRIHYVYPINESRYNSITLTPDALQKIHPTNSNILAYSLLSPSGSVEYATILGADMKTTSGNPFILGSTVFTDDCKVYIAGSYRRTSGFPVTPTYHDFETGTQKTVYNATPDISGGNFITVFHEPSPTNTITDFAPGNNTFCIGGVIYQNPNDGPIDGQPAGYTSGDGSSPTHNLPDISRDGNISAHPTPSTQGLTYQWEKSYNGTTWQTIGGGNADKLKPTPEFSSGTVQYRRAIYGSCDTVYSNTATATIAGNFNLQIDLLDSTIYYCEGNLTNLGITISNATGNISWQWYDGFAPLSSNIITPANGSGTMASFTANVATTANSTGYYRLVVTDAGGCKREAFVTIVPLTAPASSGPSAAMCPTSAGAEVTLGPNAVNPDLDYRWTGPSGFTSNSPNPTVFIAGTYYLQVKLKSQSFYCIAGETSVNVVAFQPFSANLTTLSDVNFCQADNPAIIGNGLVPPSGYVFQWSPGLNIDDATSFNPTFDPGVLPFGITPVSSVEYTFTALRLSDGCIFETKMTVTDTARAFADAGIDKPACGSNPSQYFGATEMTGTNFLWKPVATTYPGGLSALTSSGQWTMDGASTTTSNDKFLNATFPSDANPYTIDFEVTASYTNSLSGCVTKDIVRLFYYPTCGGDWCTPLTANLSGTSGACSGSTAWIQGTSLGGLTSTWTTYSVDGVVQPANTPPQGLFEYNNGVKGAAIVPNTAHSSKVIVDFDDPSWGWSGANVVVYRLTSSGNFGDGLVDCHKDIQVFSAANAKPVVGVIDNSICAFRSPGVRFGTNGDIGPYIITGSDYTTAPNSGLIWEWGQVGRTNAPFVIADGNTPFPTLDPTTSTDFWVQATDPVTGCPALDTMNLNVVEVIANAGADITNACQNSLLQLGTTAQPNHTYSWTPTAGLNDPIGTPNANSARPYLIAPNAPSGIDYTLVVTETTSGCQATDVVTIVTNTNPPPSISPATYSACAFGSFSIGPFIPFNQQAGLSYTWTAGAGADVAWLSSTTVYRPTVTLPSNFSGTAVFNLTVTKGNCGSTNASYTINDNSITINLGPNQTASCGSSLLQIGVPATSGYTYLWMPFNGLYTDVNGTTPYTGQNVSQVYVSPNVTTTYTLFGGTSRGCFAFDEITISPPAGVSANAGDDVYWCPNSAAINIGVSATGTTNWSAVGYTSNPNGTPTTPTAGQAATMIGYLSSSSSVPTTFSQSTIAAGKYVYRLSTTSSGCTVQDEVTVTVPDIVTNLAGTPQSVCLGESVQIGSSLAPGSYNYTWSALSPATANNTISNRFIARPLVTPTTTSTYQLTYTEPSSGCTYTEQVVVTVTPSPNIPDVSTAPVCAPIGSQDLTSYIPSYGSYFNPIWYINSPIGGAVINNPTSVMVTQKTDYFLVAENSLGCRDTAQLTINVENPQTPNIQSGDFVDCSTGTLDLANYQGMPSQSGYTLEWHNANNTLAASLLSNTVVGAGTYYLFEKSPNGCFSSSTTFVVETNPNCCLSLTVDMGMNQSICSAEETVTISATANGGTAPYSYTWDNGLGNGQSHTVSPTTTTTYSVTVTDAVGCTTTGQTTVTILEAPTATTTSTNPSCGISDGTITFTFPDHPTRTGIEFSLDGGNTYQPAVADNSGSVTYSNLSAGIYNLYVRWDNDECPRIINTVTLSNNQNFNVAIANDEYVCIGNSSTLHAVATNGTTPYSFTWFNSVGNTASVSVSPTTYTTYTVQAVDNAGCVTFESVYIIADPCGEICNNGIDDDGDNLIDCDDLECTPATPGPIIMD